MRVTGKIAPLEFARFIAYLLLPHLALPDLTSPRRYLDHTNLIPVSEVCSNFPDTLAGHHG